MQRQGRFNFSISNDARLDLPPLSGGCALEDDAFPFERISDIAELESWRKEINRPLSHIHKWWAQRLGTVFRAIILGALTPPGTDVLGAFYRPVRLGNLVVFDPFMGSGTTLGEAVKVGARVIGRDINPVAYFLVRNALASHDRPKILREYQSIERDVSGEIRSYYQTRLPDGRIADVLYFFWVKVVHCPRCRQEVELRSSRIFARHAYPKRHPVARAVCPTCGEISAVRYDARRVCCHSCRNLFDLQSGPAKGKRATCPSCNHDFPIAKTIRDTHGPPAHRLYAKLTLLPDGIKEYAPITEEDRALYQMASGKLANRSNPYPIVAIEPGYNTNQALGYNYRYWHEMFNDRQLLCLAILADRIRSISDPLVRELFTCLFSGTLEFNNMFASYKGEGTGAVRHLFAHHILKPERLPLEANLWGTPKSSGSFMTMFENRIIRALDYADEPFELRPKERGGRIEGEKVYDLSEKLGFDVACNYQDFSTGKRVYLSCGDSSRTDLDDRSIDAVVTDPPFFDNVHYSQLADFFYVWQRHVLGVNGENDNACTTRSEFEVQNADVSLFTDRLGAVWSEAQRVLMDSGVLAFTYHHSRPEGWHSLLVAIMRAGFGITAAHPVKAEMSVALPKRQTKEPIDLDVILVCRKQSQLEPRQWNAESWQNVTAIATEQVQRLRSGGRRLSRNDVRVIVMAQFIRRLSVSHRLEAALPLLHSNDTEIEAAITSLHDDKKMAREG
jgi:adenine-specific DNA methylase